MQSALEKHVTEAAGKVQPGAAIDFAIIIQIITTLMGLIQNCPFGNAKKAMKAGSTEAKVAVYNAVKKSGFGGNAVDLTNELIERGKNASDEELDATIESAMSLPGLSRFGALLLAIALCGSAALAGPFPIVADGPFPLVTRGGDSVSLRQDAAVPAIDGQSLPDGAPASALARDGASSDLPSLTITVAPFHCPACNTLKGYEWDGFDVTWKTGGSVSAYPEISWLDPRGVKRTLTGAYRPDQVRWSMQQAGVASSEPASSAEAQPTPHSEVERILKILRPLPHETFVDYGCGDARWCIAATRGYGCRSVGVEIDPERAAAARQAVADAGLSDRIQIIEGDATKVDVPAQVGIVYLWPDTLSALRPKLERLDRFSSVQHLVPGLRMENHGGAYVWRNDSGRRQTAAAVQRPYGAVWGGRVYSGPLCNSPGCRMCQSIRQQLGQR